MGKSIYESMNGGQQVPNAQGMSFAEFANNIRQNGISPEQMVRGLINSGRMSQQQFAQFSAIANQLTGKRS